MHRAQLTPLAALAAAAIVAGCGSSSSHSSSAAPAASGQPAASSSSSGATSSSYGGGYGAYGSHSSSTATAGKTTASTAAPAAAGSSSSGTVAAASITTKSSKLGTILAYGPKRLTVYLFEGDKGAGSSCSGACAQVWPPVTGSPAAAGGAIGADLSTIKRADGTTQVTYKGHPLYLFVKDRDSGDAYGQGIIGFGASWYALKPSGVKVDKS